MSRSIRFFLILLALALLASMRAPEVAAQTTLHSAIADLDSATATAVLHEIDLASARGIPSEPLFAKVREGRLKRAGGPRIRNAVALLAVRLDSARAALGAQSTREELVAGADALAAGASVAALRSIRLAATGQPIGTSLGALAQLVASGVPGPRATGMIVDLLRRNIAPVRVADFGNAVEADASTGVPARESAEFRFREIGSPVAATTNAAIDVGTSLTSPRAVTGTNAPGSNSTSPPKRKP